MSATALKSTNRRFSSLNYQNFEFLCLVPRSPTHTGLICEKTLKPNISSLGPFKGIGSQNDIFLRFVLFNMFRYFLLLRCWFLPGLQIRIRIGSVFNRVSGSGSGSRRSKLTHKSKNFFQNMFWNVGWPLLRAEDFFCNLDVLYGGLGIGKLQFLIKKKFNFFFSCNVFNFWSLKPWIRIRIGIQPKMLDLDLDPDEMNADPQPWFLQLYVTLILDKFKLQF